MRCPIWGKHPFIRCDLLIGYENYQRCMYYIGNIYKHIFEEASRQRNNFRNNGMKYKD